MPDTVLGCVLFNPYSNLFYKRGNWSSERLNNFPSNLHSLQDSYILAVLLSVAAININFNFNIKVEPLLSIGDFFISF